MTSYKLTCKLLLKTIYVSLFLLLGSLAFLNSKLPAVSTLKDIKLQVPLRIYSADRKLIAEYGDKRCTPVTLSQIPKDLINAIVAIEDHRFYQHPGVDLKGLLRAVVSLISTGSKEQGGSTITMQVARNFFLTRKKTYLRKLSEILLALKIEQELSKQEILALYLNKIYFGKHAYGIYAAAEVYYGKKIDELTLAQMAMLAGLPQAPSSINPIHAPAAALKRRTLVLDRMLVHGYINSEQYQAAKAEPIATFYHGKVIELKAPYIAEMVRQELVERFGEEIYDRGYEVVTTIDSNMQTFANEAITRSVAEYNYKHAGIGSSNNNDIAAINHNITGIEGAIVALNPNNGAILSLVGGVDFAKSPFNRATQAERQPGSNFKPFIYAAALEQGLTAATILNDAPIVQESNNILEEWRPQNHTKKFYGPTSLRTGIVKSRNLVSIRLLQTLGIENTIETLQKFGFSAEKLPKTLSLALGTNLITPLELAAGFSIFSNGGYRVNPFFIQAISDYQGNILLQMQPPKTIPVISPQTAYIMTSMLQEAIFNGTGKKALQLHRKDLAGKTGTTNDHFDAWYTGYNKDLVVTTWIGFDEPKSIGEYAVNTALPMWIYFMEKALQNIPERIPTPPNGIVTVKIDPATGLLARPEQTNSTYEIFTTETAPTELASANNEHTDSEQQDLIF